MTIRFFIPFCGIKRTTLGFVMTSVFKEMSSTPANCDGAVEVYGCLPIGYTTSVSRPPWGDIRKQIKKQEEKKTITPLRKDKPTRSLPHLPPHTKPPPSGNPQSRREKYMCRCPACREQHTYCSTCEKYHCRCNPC
jgi:hypothetical protein